MEIFNKLLETIEESSINNKATIENVELFVKSWKKEAESLQLRKADVSNCCKYKELLNICEGRNLHCSITWQRITDYSIEIYTGYKKTYSCFHYSDGHIKVEEAIESGINWLNGKQ